MTAAGRNMQVYQQATKQGATQIFVLGRLAFGRGDTPLHSASQWGRDTFVTALLAAGAEVDATNL